MDFVESEKSGKSLKKYFFSRVVSQTIKNMGSEVCVDYTFVS